jgi:hypothetical protein
MISLVGGTYELFQEPAGDIFEAQVNVTKDEDLNVNPESESELHEVQPTSQN